MGNLEAKTPCVTMLGKIKSSYVYSIPQLERTLEALVKFVLPNIFYSENIKLNMKILVHQLKIS